MDEKTTKEELFNRALEIAVSKGQIKDNKDVDPLRSGQQGGVYRLLSLDGKVLTRIGMGLLRRNSSKNAVKSLPLLRRIQKVVFFSCGIVIPGYFIGFSHDHYFGDLVTRICIRPPGIVQWLLFFGFTSATLLLLHRIAIYLSKGLFSTKQLRNIRKNAITWWITVFISMEISIPSSFNCP